jgi:hypothetical protein
MGSWNFTRRNTRILFTSIACISLLASAVFSQADQSTAKSLRIVFFGSSTCGECMEIKESLLKPIEKQYSPKLTIEYRDIEIEKDLTLLTAMEKGYHVTSPSPQELYFPDTVILGHDDIMKNGRRLIESYLSNPGRWHYAHAYGDSAIDTATIRSP